MKTLYAVYDTIGKAILGSPFLMRHPAAAIRAFSDAMQEKGTAINTHPNDFVLITLGYFDDEDDEKFIAERDVIITGAAMRAAITPPDATPAPESLTLRK